jgi:hypothetical protein
MSNEPEEQVDGITFWFSGSSITGTARPDELGVQLTLNGIVKDEALWKDILERLNSKSGFRIFSSNDFHVEVMNVMRMSIRELEDKNVLLERELQQKKDELVQVARERDSYRVPLSAFGKALRGEPVDGVPFQERSEHERSPAESSDVSQGR